MMVRKWDRTLRNDGVKVFAISPGYLATGLGAGVEMNKKCGAGDSRLGGSLLGTLLRGREMRMRERRSGEMVRCSLGEEMKGSSVNRSVVKRSSWTKEETPSL